jgi:hypothetical protein
VDAIECWGNALLYEWLLSKIAANVFLLFKNNNLDDFVDRCVSVAVAKSLQCEPKKKLRWIKALDSVDQERVYRYRSTVALSVQMEVVFEDDFEKQCRTCGSGLARDGVITFNLYAEC